MDILELLTTRRTYRRFDESRAIEDAAIRDMMEAFRLSSSAANAQRLRAIFVRTPELVQKVFPLTHWAGALPAELGVPREGERPTLFVLLTIDSEARTRYTDTDAGIALSNITMAAWAHGVGSCIMDNIERDAIKDVLGLAATTEIHSAIGLGYPTHHSTIVDVPESGKLAYYLDENKDYFVPKRSITELCTEM